jgi:peptidylprolyl isomerase
LFVETNKKRYGWLAIFAIAAIVVIIITVYKLRTPATSIDPSATPAGGASVLGTAGPTKVAVTPTPIVLKGGKTTASGLQYLELTPGSGESPKPGNIVTMNYIATLPDGTELANSYTDKQTASTIYGKNQLLPGWEEGVGLMKAGGKMRLVIPAKLAFGDQGSGSIPADTPILMDVEIVSIKPAPVPSTVASDKLTKTDSGLQYFDITTGDGAAAAKNSTVTTHFSIWIKTESGYDFVVSSEERDPISFTVGRGDKVFPGWDEGVTNMKVGGKRLLVIPPTLGLGSQGSGDVIPPDATLVMEISLTNTREPLVATKVEEKDFTTTASGLKYYDLKVGTGDSPKTGQTVVVNYTGWLQDGTQFDSSLDSGQPFSFQLGTGNVIPGWDEGLATMKPGGKRQMVIPPGLAYGDQAQGPIPANSTLIFEVELVQVTP